MTIYKKNAINVIKGRIYRVLLSEFFFYSFIIILYNYKHFSS